VTLKDTKTGVISNVTFEHLRKINFEELLTLLPQNFDAEIAETLGKYRYRKVEAEPEQSPDPAPVQEKTVHTDDSVKRTRTGRVYKIDIKKLPEKYSKIVSACTVRMAVIPKVIPSTDAKPLIPILKKRSETKFIRNKNEIKKVVFEDRWSEDSLNRVYNYTIPNKHSVIRSEKECTKEFILDGNKPPGRVKFGNITAYFYSQEN
jgi:hypothetical protein